jgi:hypothetical protein
MPGRLTVEVPATISKDMIMAAVRALTIHRYTFDPGPWCLGDAEDFEAAARLIRREIAAAARQERP